jgi:hypothetical protein
MINWACTAINDKEHLQDWELAQVLIVAAIEFAKTYDREHRPWDLIPDIEYAAKISALINEKMEEHWAKEVVNLQHYLYPELAELDDQRTARKRNRQK